MKLLMVLTATFFFSSGLIANSAELENSATLQDSLEDPSTPIKDPKAPSCEEAIAAYSYVQKVQSSVGELLIASTIAKFQGKLVGAPVGPVTNYFKVCYMGMCSGRLGAKSWTCEQLLNGLDMPPGVSCKNEL